MCTAGATSTGRANCSARSATALMPLLRRDVLAALWRTRIARLAIRIKLPDDDAHRNDDQRSQDRNHNLKRRIRCTHLPSERLPTTAAKRRLCGQRILTVWTSDRAWRWLGGRSLDRRLRWPDDHHAFKRPVGWVGGARRFFPTPSTRLRSDHRVARLFQLEQCRHVNLQSFQRTKPLRQQCRPCLRQLVSDEPPPPRRENDEFSPLILTFHRRH